MMRRTIAAAVLALSTTASVLTAATSTATGTAPEPSASAPQRQLAEKHARQQARRALRQAQEVVAGQPQQGDTRVEGTLALRELYNALPDLDATERRQAAGVLARPTDGSSDQYGDGYTVPSKRSCDGNVCLHWVPTTKDAPPSRAWVDKTLATMNSVWTREVGQLKYRPPLADLNRGGNALFDVYLKELGSKGLYGYCAPEAGEPGTPDFLASGYCVLDNDFARSQYGAAPTASLQVTAAHEFFHAIQFGYDAGEDGWFMETTATWMEERYADSINDNRQFLRYGQVRHPAGALDFFNANGWNQYGNWAFFEYLGSRYGIGVVRQIWDAAAYHEGGSDLSSIEAVKARLRSEGTHLRPVFAQYAAGNTVPASTYAEGAAWPSASISRTWTLDSGSPRQSQTFTIDHLASNNARIVPGSSLTAKRWRVRISIDGPGRLADPAAYLTIERRNGELVRQAIKLDSTGVGGATAGFSNRTVRRATVTLANASTRFECWQQTAYACQGTPRDENRKFALSVRAFRG